MSVKKHNIRGSKQFSQGPATLKPLASGEWNLHVVFADIAEEYIAPIRAFVPLIHRIDSFTKLAATLPMNATNVNLEVFQAILLGLLSAELDLPITSFVSARAFPDIFVCHLLTCLSPSMRKDGAWIPEKIFIERSSVRWKPPSLWRSKRRIVRRKTYYL